MGKMMDYLGRSMKRFINRGLLDLKVKLRPLDKVDPTDIVSTLERADNTVISPSRDISWTSDVV